MFVCLFIIANEAAVDQCHVVGDVAAFTHPGLSDSVTVHFYKGNVGAHLALQEDPMHLWNQLRHPDHHATDDDELVNVFWIQVSHILTLQHSEWSSLNLT